MKCLAAIGDDLFRILALDADGGQIGEDDTPPPKRLAFCEGHLAKSAPEGPFGEIEPAELHVPCSTFLR